MNTTQRLAHQRNRMDRALPALTQQIRQCPPSPRRTALIVLRRRLAAHRAHLEDLLA